MALHQFIFKGASTLIQVSPSVRLTLERSLSFRCCDSIIDYSQQLLDEKKITSAPFSLGKSSMLISILTHIKIAFLLAFPSVYLSSSLTVFLSFCLIVCLVILSYCRSSDTNSVFRRGIADFDLGLQISIWVLTRIEK